MALTACKECGGQVSTAAKACPQCGASPARQYGCGTVIVLGIGIMFLYTLFSGNNAPSTTRPPEDPRAAKLSAARGACLIVLKQSLNDPGSADFSLTSEWYTEERSDGTTLVQPKARAKNAFGAYIQGTWDCTVRHEGANVRVLSLRQIRP